MIDSRGLVTEAQVSCYLTEMYIIFSFVNVRVLYLFFITLFNGSCHFLNLFTVAAYFERLNWLLLELDLAGSLMLLG